MWRPSTLLTSSPSRFALGPCAHLNARPLLRCRTSAFCAGFRHVRQTSAAESMSASSAWLMMWMMVSRGSEWIDVGGDSVRSSSGVLIVELLSRFCCVFSGASWGDRRWDETTCVPRARAADAPSCTAGLAHRLSPIRTPRTRMNVAQRFTRDCVVRKIEGTTRVELGASHPARPASLRISSLSGGESERVLDDLDVGRCTGERLGEVVESLLLVSEDLGRAKRSAFRYRLAASRCQLTAQQQKKERDSPRAPAACRPRRQWPSPGSRRLSVAP